MKKMPRLPQKNDTMDFFDTCGVWLGDTVGVRQDVSFDWNPEEGLRLDWFGHEEQINQA